MLVDDTVSIVSDDDRRLGAAHVDASDERPVEPGLMDRDHRANAPSTHSSNSNYP